MLHACSYTVCLVFCYTSWCFYAFSGTNLLTRCHRFRPPAARLRPRWSMATALRCSPVMARWSTRSGAMRRSRWWGRRRSWLPVTVPALGRSGAASVELRRRIPVALVLLRIREKVREMRLGKARRTEALEGLAALWQN
jgi:hypothetical protein